MCSRILLTEALSILLLAAGAMSCSAESAPPTEGPQKFALLVGINEYQNVTDLRGCVNDVQRMKALLVNNFQFPETNVTVLTDSTATRAGIINAFQRGLIDKAKAGDIVVFHFSGHGSRMKDTNGDEIDGLDETLVPHDSRAGTVFDLNDDLINDLLRQLSQKTKNITFVLDSCHSGSATRGGAQVRRVPDDERTPPAEAAAPTSSARGAQGASDLRPLDANYVLITGCKAHQLSNEFAVEGHPQGVLTYYLTEALRNASQARTTYRDLMDTVRHQVAIEFPSQEPEMEGAGADALVFSGAQSVAQAHVLVSPGQGGGEIAVEAGAVYGLSKGSVLDVYAPATKTFGPEAKRAARIELTTVGPLASSAKVLDGRVSAKFSRAVLREQAFPDFKLKLHVAGVERSPTLLKIKGELEKYPSLQIVADERNCHLRLREEAGKIVTEAADTSPRSPPVTTSDPDAVGHVVKQVLQWNKWYAVQSIANPASQVAVQAHFSPAPAASASPGAPRAVVAGERLDMVVENKSDLALFVAVLDLSSDGSIDVIFPPEGGGQQLQARTKSGPLKIEFFVPEGRSSVEDTIKVFATSGPIDPQIFRQAAVKSGQERSASSTDPLASLLESSMLGRTRGARPLPLETWTTAQNVFLVKKSAQ